MRHTLREFMNFYNPQHIQLVFGVHLISIDTSAEGSYKIVQAFLDYKFDLTKVDSEAGFQKAKYLVLTH